MARNDDPSGCLFLLLVGMVLAVIFSACDGNKKQIDELKKLRQEINELRNEKTHGKQTQRGVEGED